MILPLHTDDIPGPAPHRLGAAPRKVRLKAGARVGMLEAVMVLVCLGGASAVCLRAVPVMWAAWGPPVATGTLAQSSECRYGGCAGSYLTVDFRVGSQKHRLVGYAEEHAGAQPGDAVAVYSLPDHTYSLTRPPAPETLPMLSLLTLLALVVLGWGLYQPASRMRLRRRMVAGDAMIAHVTGAECRGGGVTVTLAVPAADGSVEQVQLRAAGGSKEANALVGAALTVLCAPHRPETAVPCCMLNWELAGEA